MKMQIDIFCHIIDNYGDIGVLYRLSKDLIQNNPNIKPRIFTNKIEDVKKLNQNIDVNLEYQKINGISFIDIDKFNKNLLEKIGISKFIIEGFGCELPDFYLKQALNRESIIINLEYLSAESWVEDYHLMPSIVNSKTAKKFFFMPGFTKKTGGIILDNDYLNLRNSLSQNRENFFNLFFNQLNIDLKFENDQNYISIFTYEHNFNNLFNYLSDKDKNFTLFIMGEKSKNSVLDFFRDNTLKKMMILLLIKI